MSIPMRLQLLTRSAAAPWGDYGTVLWHGIAQRHGPTLHLMRAGPFLPPISFPIRGIVIADHFRGDLEDAGFRGLSFGEVVKERIVPIPWTDWDEAAPEPRRYPRSGEPADYLLRGRHSSTTAATMETAWELVPTGHVDFLTEEDPASPSRIRVSVNMDTWDGSDWVKGRSPAHCLVSDPVAAYLRTTVAKWITLTPVP